MGIAALPFALKLLEPSALIGCWTAAEYVADCPLCPRNKRSSGALNPDYGGIFVFDNDLPCVGPDAPRDLDPAPGVYRNRPAEGNARVVCYTPRHDLTLAELEGGEILALLTEWQVQYRDLGKRSQIRADGQLA